MCHVYSPQCALGERYWLLIARSCTVVGEWQNAASVYICLRIVEFCYCEGFGEKCQLKYSPANAMAFQQLSISGLSGNQIYVYIIIIVKSCLEIHFCVVLYNIYYQTMLYNIASFPSLKQNIEK